MAVYFNCNPDNGKPAARVGDSVCCPQHGKVTITSGSGDTSYDGMPAARVGDKTSCDDTIIEGSGSVKINGKLAAFVGCTTAHGGEIITGSPTVFLGNKEAGSPDEPGVSYSMSVDFSMMQESGDHNDLSHSHIAVKVTKTDGTYLTTTCTDEHGVTHRFYTKEQEDVVVWADFGHWRASEEFEEVHHDDGEETG